MKHMKMAGAAMIGAFILWGAATAAKAPLATTNKWVVDFADHQCLATRNYGTAEKPLYLMLKPSPAGDVMQVAVAQQSRLDGAVESEARLRFDAAPPIKASLISFRAPKNDLRFNSVYLPLATFAPMRSASLFAIDSGVAVDQRFQLGPMGPLMTAIDNCLADLKKHWNVGPDHDAKLAQPPRTEKPLGSYFSSDDYPRVAIRSMASGNVGLVVLVDETGKIGDCMITETSGVASLDSQACAIIFERARFQPASGTDGKPIKGAVQSRIRWHLP